jgi:SPP1 gp7 family putative phage head morphogenesis protein
MVHYEIQHAVNIGIETRYKEDGVEKVEWLACADEHVCEYCEEMDGQQFPIDDHPDCPADPFCRCTWTPVIEIP